MAEETDLDLEKVQEFIKSQVDTYATEAFKQYQQQAAPAVQQQQALSNEQQAALQLQQTLDPFIRPGLNAAQFAAADAADKVDFYLNRPEYADLKEDVEKMFTDLKAQGRAIPRADIAHYLLGKMATDQPEVFTKRQTARQKQQLDTAQGATDFGLGAVERAKNDPIWSNVRNMPLTELEKALEGVTF